jgi:hypothetical protein
MAAEPTPARADGSTADMCPESRSRNPRLVRSRRRKRRAGPQHRGVLGDHPTRGRRGFGHRPGPRRSGHVTGCPPGKQTGSVSAVRELPVGGPASACRRPKASDPVEPGDVLTLGGLLPTAGITTGVLSLRTGPPERALRGPHPRRPREYCRVVLVAQHEAASRITTAKTDDITQERQCCAFLFVVADEGSSVQVAQCVVMLPPVQTMGRKGSCAS